MADGIPAPTSGKLVFRATLPIDQTHEVGATQYGQRRLLTSKSGMITGDRLQGSFLEGGLDFELTLSNGTIELERVDMLRSSDGALIYLRTCGIAPANEATVRIVPDFEVATSSSLAWLNTGKFAGTRSVDLTKKEIEYVVYDVSEAAAGEPLVRLQDPAGVPNQPWNCSTMTGQRGDTVFTEQVTLGGSLSVGASKRGTRNVIPITGGTVSGRITGKVVPGGADYQLVSGTSTLDARYALESNDGEVIIVRNCGPFGALIPLFETRAESDYAYLNANTFLSSDPGVGGGGVSITFYERR